ncbi:MAG: family 16 glycosylhydrolase [Solirubrobacteraceae bacterium]
MVRGFSAYIAASFVAVVALLTVVAVDTARAEPLPNGVPGNWALILNEEFSANGLNTALWTPEWPSGAMSGQCTSPSLVSQPGNGYLYLQVRAQNSTCSGIKNSNTGALVESNPADGKPGHSGFLYSYGYVEWHVYIVGWGGEEQGCPRGGCIPDWPALWSFPENQENEIDTMEGLHGKACHTWHHHVSPIEETQGCQSGSYAGWHTYGTDWEPGVLTFYYDGAKVGEVKTGYINSTPQYLIMNEVPPGCCGGELVVPDEIVVDYARVWQHPVPPSATTGSATNVQETQATLNGTVNPNRFDTHYYFQYGPTTSYGTNAPAPPGSDAGSGTSSVPASATITGLTTGTAYHYRIVATSAGGTTYGSDQEVRTRGSLRWIFYNGGGSLEESYWNGSSWGYVPLGHAITGSPGAGVDAANHQDVFYNGGSSLEESYWNGSSWGYVPLGHAITGSPSVGIDAAHHQCVFYNGGGSLEESYWNGSSWGYVPLGHAITGNPAVGVDAAGDQWVFYNGGGSLEESYWNGKEWGYVPLHHAIVGSPAVAVDSAGEQFVVYNGGGSLEESIWNGKEWEYIPLHHGITGNPSIVINPHTREQWIFYNGGTSLEESAWNGKEWEYVPLHHAITGNPTAVANTGNLE